MEREARKVREKHYAGNRKEQVCSSIVINEMENKYNNGTMPNRMLFKQKRHKVIGWGGWGGVPPGGTPARIG